MIEGVIIVWLSNCYMCVNMLLFYNNTSQTVISTKPFHKGAIFETH